MYTTEKLIKCTFRWQFCFSSSINSFKVMNKNVLKNGQNIAISVKFHETVKLIVWLWFRLSHQGKRWFSSELSPSWLCRFRPPWFSCVDSVTVGLWYPSSEVCRVLHFVLYFVCFDALPCLILCLYAFYCVRVACLRCMWVFSHCCYVIMFVHVRPLAEDLTLIL